MVFISLEELVSSTEVEGSNKSKSCNSMGSNEEYGISDSISSIGLVIKWAVAWVVVDDHWSGLHSCIRDIMVDVETVVEWVFI